MFISIIARVIIIVIVIKRCEFATTTKERNKRETFIKKMKINTNLPNDQELPGDQVTRSLVLVSGILINVCACNAKKSAF